MELLSCCIFDDFLLETQSLEKIKINIKLSAICYKIYFFYVKYKHVMIYPQDDHITGKDEVISLMRKGRIYSVSVLFQ